MKGKWLIASGLTIGILFVSMLVLFIATTIFTFIAGGDNENKEPSQHLHVHLLTEMDTLLNMAYTYMEVHADTIVEVSMMEDPEQADIVFGLCADLQTYHAERPLVAKRDLELPEALAARTGSFNDSSNMGTCVNDETAFFPYIPDMNVFINHDILDMFAVPYPAGTISLDQLIELVPDVTGQVDDTPFNGVVVDVHQLLRSYTYMFPLVDLHEQQSRIYDTKEWREIFNQLLRIYDIPGIAVYERHKGTEEFLEEQRTALYVGTSDIEETMDVHQNKTNRDLFDWGKVHVEEFATERYAFAIPQQTEMREEAVHFISSIRLHNVELNAVDELSQALVDVVNGERDAGSALREVDERMQTAIEEHVIRN